jgi:hypothetical protein
MAMKTPNSDSTPLEIKQNTLNINEIEAGYESFVFKKRSQRARKCRLQMRSRTRPLNP